MPVSSARMRNVFQSPPRAPVLVLAIASVCLLVSAAGAGAVPASLVQQGEKLTVGEESGRGEAGASVAVSADGNTALIGGPGDAGELGAAWVFTRSGSAWTQQGPKLTAAGESALGAFGSSVALSGDGNTAFIGAPRDEFGGNQLGSVRVFTRSGSNWTEVQKLQAGPSGPHDEFGTSLAISEDGNTAVIGGPQDEEKLGVGWVVKRSGGKWSVTVGLDSCELREEPSGICIKREEESKSEPGRLGDSVAISGDGKTIMLGAPFDADEKGSIWTYKKRRKERKASNISNREPRRCWKARWRTPSSAARSLSRLTATRPSSADRATTWAKVPHRC